MNCQRAVQMQGRMSGATRLARKAICRASAQTVAAVPLSPPATNVANPLMLAAISTLFKIPPVFNAAKNKARETIRQRAIAIGLDWDKQMEDLQKEDWNSRAKQVINPAVTAYPSYYTQPFHAYNEGNMCWEAALEVTQAAKSVHALVMDPEGKHLDSEGDVKMRRSFNMRTRENMLDLDCNPDTVKDVVDLGCATGLSSVAVLNAFPGCHVTGVDLSPQFLAVGQYQQEQRQAASGHPESLTLIHGYAERTGLPSASYDLVSMCLVCHELPQSATKEIFKEAFRLLRPGGCLSVMEMDPAAPAWARAISNPFAFAGFRSTEPWLEEYMALDMPQAMRDAGFQGVVQRPCTPRHKTVVARKPQL